MTKQRILIVCISASFILLLITYNLMKTYSSKHLAASNNGQQRPLQGFVVNTPGCKIPDVDPFDATVKKFIHFLKPLVCNATSAITYIDGNNLRINRTALRNGYKDELDYCEYQSIHRPDVASDRTYKYSSQRTTFRRDVQVSEDFIRVACYGKGGGMIYANFHPFILEKSSVERRCKTSLQQMAKASRSQEPLNILAIGLDSISRLNFIRQLSTTREYLLNDLHSVELKGYNKVADNTYVNIVPMFAGKFVEELPWDESVSYKPFDDFPFLWNNFSENAYRTLFAEDAPKIAIFNYLKEGFHKPPADYYLRPFSLAMEDHGSIWRNDHDCVGPMLETNVVLDYVTRFIDHFKKERHFALAFITRLTHDNINKAGLADLPVYMFFKALKEKGLIEKTAVLFFSDHGMRFGGIRKTHIGKLEERLPFMYISFPDWFRKRYPTHIENLRTNSQRLTTPFDIYETLADILHFRGEIREADVHKRGISLFSQVPIERTCEHAAILPHWCTCHLQLPVPTSDTNITSAAKVILTQINKEIESYQKLHLCAVLSVAAIHDARIIMPNENVLHFENSLHDVLGRTVSYGKRVEPLISYSLTVQTKPGGGLFEATVGYTRNDNHYRILGDISRIDPYRDQSTCITTHRHKKFCYCL